MSHGVECKTTNQKTRVRNFTKKKENRTALQLCNLALRDPTQCDVTNSTTLPFATIE